jgi:hypothetical protein
MLAEQAEAAYDAAGPKHDAERKNVRDWLVMHPARPG